MFIKRSKYNELLRENIDLMEKAIKHNDEYAEALNRLVVSYDNQIKYREEIKQLRIQIGDLKGWVVKSEK